MNWLPNYKQHKDFDIDIVKASIYLPEEINLQFHHQI